jgi:hypothetical protein
MREAVADKVVVCVFDGLRPDLVSSERTPNMQRFARRATWFREARSVFPSMTRVATTSVATGAPPSVHGVMGNMFYMPEVTARHVLDLSAIDDIRLAEQATQGRLVTAATMGDQLAKAGRRMAVVHCGSAGSTHCINPRARENGHWTFSIFGPEHTPTPDAVTSMVERFGPLPPRNLPRFEETEYVARIFVEHVLPDLAADVSLIWFNEPDTSCHYKFLGNEETLAVLKCVDDAFGRILDWIEAQPDADRIAVIIASDHGQISSTGVVELWDHLTRAGHTAFPANARHLEGAAITLTGGNMGEIRILEGGHARRDAIARWLMEQPFIGGLYSAPLNEVDGVVPGTLALSLVDMHHADRQPDLVYVLRSDETADPFGFPGQTLITGGVPVGGTMHGGLNRHELNTVLMVSAAGMVTGAVSHDPCGIIDIAPTVLALLGVPAAPSMTGRSLGSLNGAMVERVHEAGVGNFRQTLRTAEQGDRRILIGSEPL